MNPISGTVSKARLPELIERTIDKDKFQYDIVFTERQMLQIMASTSPLRWEETEL